MSEIAAAPTEDDTDSNNTMPLVVLYGEFASEDNNRMVVLLMAFVFGFPLLVITTLCLIQQRSKFVRKRSAAQRYFQPPTSVSTNGTARLGVSSADSDSTNPRSSGFENNSPVFLLKPVPERSARLTIKEQQRSKNNNNTSQNAEQYKLLQRNARTATSRPIRKISLPATFGNRCALTNDVIMANLTNTPQQSQTELRTPQRMNTIPCPVQKVSIQSTH